MNMTKLPDRRIRRRRNRAADRHTRRVERTEPLGLDLLDVMIDLDPGMLVWSVSEASFLALQRT